MDRTSHSIRAGAVTRRLVVTALAAACLLFAAPAAQGGLKPTLTCVDVSEDGTITAHFGYTNTGDDEVNVPAGGLRNFFLPPPGDRGQPSSFSPGTYSDVFSVTFNGPFLSWQLGGDGGAGVAIATANSTRCTNVPAMGLDSPWPALLAAVGLGVAVVLRRRPAGPAGA